MDPLIRLLLRDTLTPEQARILRLALHAQVESLERWVRAYPEDEASREELAGAWSLQAKLFAEGDAP